MRRLSILLAAAFALASAAFAQTKINPSNQINWPAITGSGAPSPALCNALNYGKPYVDTTGNVSYVCSGSGWTSPASLGPIGSGQILYNNGGGFGGFTANGDCTIAVSTGLVTCTKTNGNLFAPSATTDTTNANNITSGALNMLLLNPYRQNAYIAPARTVNAAVSPLFAVPQDRDANAGNGIDDDAASMNAEIDFLASQNTNADKTLVLPWTPQGYQLYTVNYLVTLPWSFGDYHGSAGFTLPAAASLYFTNGQLSSCSVTGGAKYAPNAQLPIQIIDPTYQGSGAIALAPTDANGTPTGACTVLKPGMHYVNPTQVQANIIPLGGDGAAGTVDLVSGVITNPQTTAGGSGYSIGLTAQVPGLTCATPPSLNAPTITNASVTAFTIASGGATCTYGGNANATGIPVAFGESCLSTTGQAQCHIVAPSTPQQLGCAVALRNGVNIQGIGNPTVTTGFSAVSPAGIGLAGLVAFCDFAGDQALWPAGLTNPTETASLKFSGFTVNAFVPFWFAGPVQGVRWNDMVIKGGVPMYMAAVEKTSNQPVSLPQPTTSITDSVIYAFSGPVIGMGWTSRNPVAGGTHFGGGGGDVGGTVLGHPAYPQAGQDLNPAFWGVASGLKIDNTTISLFNIQFTSSAAAIDNFFEQYVWQAQNGPATPSRSGVAATLSNGGTTCPTALTITDQTTDYDFGPSYSSGQSAFYPYYTCFPGVSGAGVVAMPRFWSGLFSGNDLELNRVTFNAVARPILVGAFGNIRLTNVYADNGTSVFPADPYLPAGVTQHVVSVFGPSATRGNIDTLTLNRGSGYTAPLVQIRPLGQAGPTFTNGLRIENVTNTCCGQTMLNQSDPFPLSTPATSSAACTQGVFTFDTSYMYICTASGAWKRVALTTF